MSTKAIREALDYLENNPTADEAQAARRRAREELANIERACVFVVRESAITDVENEHVNVIRCIARDAP